MITRTYQSAYLSSHRSEDATGITIDYTDSKGQWHTITLPDAMRATITSLTNNHGRIMDCNRSQFLALIS